MMTQEIPTVHHNEQTQTTYQPRSLTESIPMMHDNIPTAKTNVGLYVLASLLTISIFVNIFVYADIYRKIDHVHETVDIIQTEQMSRVDRVYNKTRDRFYRQDFKDWIVEFEALNKDVLVPKIPDKSIYEY